MQSMFKKMDNLYTDLSEYYVFDKQKYTLEEFFTDLKTFKDSFLVSLKVIVSFVLVILVMVEQEAKKDNEKEREMEEKNKKAKLAREKAERERQEREARKKAIIDMNPTETQEGVMDRYDSLLLFRVLSLLTPFLAYWRRCKREARLITAKRENELQDL